ncbi:MAG: addiction module protein [Candidatus Hydrogenedentes bacterium]|nr:addiction module protein [Candidatus Hydrogenedentota bacterium]
MNASDASSKEILVDALQLPPVERATLVEEILSSFDFPERHEIDALWAREAEDRIDAYEQGKLTTSPISRVFDRINREADR